ncbi:hypothetical protein ma133 [Moumouvirus australiensis]|uniref:Uncharacterized protein n=1 Tax=Moumouvirus australiensis TaxID=2109587 RepID=A0A2P1EKU9_9VIRU|nr:hypothetical protein QKC55_gp771 [Moumouvirus australiensis]AVL94519.1 hypothetical protein ma133 [Moumouvirus australiensis]
MYDLDLIYNIVSGNHQVSLRTIDWFVTNYCKTYNIILDDHFNVQEEYRSELKYYTKEYFEVFCRKHKGIFYTETGEEIKLSIGQINFFNWCIKNNIIDCIKKNHSNIIRDMSSAQKIENITHC